MAKAKAASYKLDIKRVLEAVDRNDTTFYTNLTEDEKKAFSAWTVMRFVSSSANHPEHYLTMVNCFVNEDFNELSKHPELQWRLLCLCGAGTKQFHPWIAPPRKKGKNKVQAFLATVYPNSNQDDLETLEKINTRDDLVEMAKDMGMSDKEIKELF